MNMTVENEIKVATGAVPDKGKVYQLTVGRVLKDDSGKLRIKLDTIPTWTMDKSGKQVPFDGWFDLDPPRPPPSGAGQKVA